MYIEMEDKIIWIKFIFEPRKWFANKLTKQIIGEIKNEAYLKLAMDTLQ